MTRIYTRRRLQSMPPVENGNTPNPTKTKLYHFNILKKFIIQISFLSHNFLDEAFLLLLIKDFWVENNVYLFIFIDE